MTIEDYQAELTSLMERFRSTFEADTPVHVGRIGRRGGNGITDDVLDPAFDAIAGAQEAVAAAEYNVDVVARGARFFREQNRMLSTDAGELHYGLAGVTYLGRTVEAATA